MRSQTVTRTNCAVMLLLSCGASQQALAQSIGEPPSAEPESPPETLRENLSPEEGPGIVITGSRIQRRDASSVGPLTTLTEQDIRFAAPTSVGDLVQALPSAGVSLNSNGTQGTSFGVSAINLRYLGSSEGSGNRTLVLVDGHRWVNAVGGRGFRDFVDLNTIPLGIVDRIEVLKDGASAIYGADAIAGVVNILTKDRLDGLEANARLGLTSRGDNQNYSGYINWGTVRDRLSLLASVSYNDTKPLRTDARALTARALSPVTAPPPSDRGLYQLPGLSNNPFFGTPAGFAANAANAITRLPGVTAIGSGRLADDSFRVARLPGDDFNTLTQGLFAIGPSERVGVFGRLAFEMTNDIRFKLEGLYNHRESSQVFSSRLLDVRGSNGFAISADQTFNPFGTANGVPAANALAFSGNSFRIRRFADEVGNRTNVQKIDTYRIAAGLDGKFLLAGEWNWDAYASYSRNEATFDALNQINNEALYLALRSPEACAAVAGCVPLNIFGIISPEQANYIRFNGHDEQEVGQYDFVANVSRDLFNLPGGPLGLAAGYEYRREEAVDRPDAFAASLSNVLPRVGGQLQEPTTAAARDPTMGSFDLHEVYAELYAPLLADRPLAYRLDINAAVRYSEYSTVGGKATVKVGVAYRPITDILLRGTYSQGFRAPSILELNQGRRNTNFQAIDLCNGGGAGLPGCAGVPASYNQTQFGAGVIPGVISGNPNLVPETADTYSLGAALTPSFLPRFSLTVDWFQISIKDAIDSQTPTQLLQACAVRLSFCNLITRDVTGEVLELRQSVVNLSKIEVSGVDATARYAIPTGFGDFEAAVDVSYLDRFRTTVPQPDGSFVVDERAGKSDQPRTTFPRWKGQASLRYFSGPIDAGVKTRYIGPSDDIPNNAVNGGQIKGIFYSDVQLGFTPVGTGYSFALGVDNLLDQQPPASAANNPINFDIYTYDVRGRYFYVRAGVKF